MAKHVEALVDAVEAGDLGAQHPAVVGGEQALDVHLRGARVVAGVAGGVRVRPQEGDPGGLELLLGRAGPAGDHVEHLHDRGALGGLVLGVPAADVLRGDPGLAVRRTGQRDDPRAGQDGVLDLDGVTGGPDVRVRGPHVPVDLDAPARAELDAGSDGQLGVRADARAHDDQGGLEEPAAGQLDGELPGLVGGERGGRRRQVQRDPVGAQVVLHRGGELLVQRRHDLVGHLDDLDRQPALVQVLGHLQADVPGADDDHVLEAGGARGDGVDLGLDVVHVLDVAQDVDVRGGRGRAAVGGTARTRGTARGSPTSRCTPRR